MKTYIKIAIVTIFLFSLLLSGCTQENNNEKEETHKVDLVYHKIESGGKPPNDFKEVIGQIKNNDTKDYDKVEIIVYFYDNNNEMIHSGTYTVYDLLQNYSADFIVHYNYLNPNFTKYDHYTITLKVE